MPSQMLTNPSATTTAAHVPVTATILSRPGGLFMWRFYALFAGISMNLLPWLKRKWRELVPGKVQTLGMLGTKSGGCVFQTNRLPHSTRVTTTPPNYTDEFKGHWYWLTPPLEGVTLQPEASTYTNILADVGAKPGRGQIQCVYTRIDGAEFRSNPFNITVIDPDDSQAGA